MTPPFLLSPRALSVALMIVAVVAVAVADVCLKRAAVPGSLAEVLRSPWTLLAVALYLVQFVLLVVIFLNGWKLSVVGLLQTVLYAAVTFGAGVLLFDEALSLRQALGLVLGAGAVALLSV